MELSKKSIYEQIKSEMRNIGKARISLIFSLIFFISTFAIVIYYIAYPSEGYLHSDCSDSLYWANATVESGQLIADNFRYAAILPFSANIWMIPLIKMFGVTMKTQIISMIIFAILYTASQLWLFKTMRFSWPLNFTATGCMLMLLSSSVKMREIMWEHVIYYSLAILLFNCLLALALTMFQAWERLKSDKKATVSLTFCVSFVLLCVLSMCTSTNGFQIIIMTTAPIFLGIAAEAFFENRSKLFSLDNSDRICAVFSIPVFTVLGLIVLNVLKGDVTAGYTDYYSRFASIDSWDDNLFKFHNHFITLLGYDANKSEIASMDALHNLFAILIFVILVLLPFVSLLFYKKFRYRETKVAILSYIGLFCAIMFVFICGNISNVNWRLIPVVGLSMIPLFAVINELLAVYKEWRTDKKTSGGAVALGSLAVRLSSVLVAVFVVFSLLVFKEIKDIPADYGQDNTLHVLTETLIEHDLEYGYATFWRSQAITMLSDSEVKCREILATAANGAKTDYYQSSYDWYSPQEGVDKYFVLLSNAEYAAVMNHENWKSWIENQFVERIDVNGYFIFVFDGYLEGIQ